MEQKHKKPSSPLRIRPRHSKQISDGCEPSLNKWYQALLAAASRHESGANYYGEVRQAKELYMKSSSKPFQFHSCWEICKRWVLFEDPPKRAPTPMFETACSAIDMDEDGSPTIQQRRVENPSLVEGFIPRAMGRNKARRLKEKGKTNDNYAAQHEVVASLRLLVEQNALEAEEMKRRHEERAKQIQEEMDDKNMERNTSNYTPMSKAHFDRKKKEIMSRRQLFTSDYTPTMADDEDDVDYGY
ncbi:hypothetical protein D8674_011609 [Pyrus ussuriensis x Pyrus communis]|uniref:No apical meristem-associated C-terminal domain-containing protein n=1 Tax=Pyrus ussuriensis x Pyrus communis TaxID=2448454 RepID=A0A5N5G3V1_9ROSA|nr:hypothetical protein D8674_011609 [Pyrus ussuriensis x Pyrus communis]